MSSEKDWKELHEWEEKQQQIKNENELKKKPKKRGIEKLDRLLKRIEATSLIIKFIVFFGALLFVALYYNSIK